MIIPDSDVILLHVTSYDKIMTKKSADVIKNVLNHVKSCTFLKITLKYDSHEGSTTFSRRLELFCRHFSNVGFLWRHLQKMIVTMTSSQKFWRQSIVFDTIYNCAKFHPSTISLRMFSIGGGQISPHVKWALKKPLRPHSSQPNPQQIISKLT